MYSLHTLGRTKNSRDHFLVVAKDGISIQTTKEAARRSQRLSHLICTEGTADASFTRVDVRLLLLGVQWLEYANSQLIVERKCIVLICRLILRSVLQGRGPLHRRTECLRMLQA